MTRFNKSTDAPNEQDPDAASSSIKVKPQLTGRCFGWWASVSLQILFRAELL